MLQTAAQTAYRRNAALLAQAQRTVGRQATVRDQVREIGTHQILAAKLATQTAAAVLAEQDVDVDGPTVLPAAFTADAVTLEEMVTGADRLSLSLLTQVLVGDAGKSAGGVYAASRPRQVGYVRYLVGASCERCAILAGRWYRWSAGFQRHPRCDCINLPATQEASSELVSNPHEAFESGQIHGLSRAQEQAIREGADINQVVNAYRGMRMVNFAGRRVGQGARPTPEAIYRRAPTREMALELLRRHGYVK